MIRFVEFVGVTGHSVYVCPERVTYVLEDAAKTILSLLSRQRVESELRKGGGGGGGERLG